MAGGETLIEARGVSKRFGPRRVLRRVSLSVAAGEVVLLLGPNGAGKSTLLRVLAGLMRHDEGDVARATPCTLGFLSHVPMLYSRLTVRENLRLFSDVAGAPADAAVEAMQYWALADIADCQVGDLSRGNQARAGLARAFLGAPRLRLLDEPSSNLDERGVSILLAAVGEKRVPKPATIIATHDLHRLQPIATRVIVMKDGEVVSDSGPSAAPEALAQVASLYREANR